MVDKWCRRRHLYHKSYSTKYRSTIEIINLKMTFNNASIIWKSDVLLLNVLDGTQGCAELSNFVFKVYINVRGKSGACIDKYTFHWTQCITIRENIMYRSCVLHAFNGPGLLTLNIFWNKPSDVLQLDISKLKFLPVIHKIKDNLWRKRKSVG